MSLYVEPKMVTDPSECLWYHDFELPGLPKIRGFCDMSPAFPLAIEAVKLRSKSVLEVGPASGAYTFAMERAGAEVTSVELSASDEWDFVPHARPFLGSTDNLPSIQNSYWFAHRLLGSHAKVYPSSVYNIEALGQFDVGTIHAVLVHLRDPMLAIQRVAEHVKDTLIITDAEPFAEDGLLTPLRIIARKARFMTYMPRAEHPDNYHSWWHISPGAVAEHCKILGFVDVKINYFRARFFDRMMPFYCIVACR